MTPYVVSLMNANSPLSVILAWTAYVKRSSMSAGSYSISNDTGTWPGSSMIFSAIVTAGASARDTSISFTSITAFGVSAIFSRYVIVPVIDAVAGADSATKL